MRLRVEAGPGTHPHLGSRSSSVRTGGLALGLAVLNRGYLAPYGSALGQFVLLLVGGLFAASFVWLSKMTRAAEPERFLGKAPATTARDGFLEARS